ncbi:MAG: TolC family protein [Myxococcota bacterium]
MMLLPLLLLISERPVDAYLHASAALYAETAQARGLDERIAAAEAQHRADLAQSPFTLSAGVAHTQYRRQRSPASLTRNFDTTLSTSLDLALRNSLHGTLQGSLIHADESAPSGLSPTPGLFDLSLTFSYDLVRGGDTSGPQDRARAAAANALASELLARADRLDGELAFLSLAAEIYGLGCKAKLLEEQRALIQKLVEAAELQSKAKALSKADLLNLQTLMNSVLARQAEIDLSRLSAEQRLASSGAEVRRALGDRVAVALASGCVSEDSGAEAPDLDVAGLAARTPLVAAADAAVAAAGYDARALETELSFGLSPYVSGRMGRANGLDNNVDYSGTIGLSFDWNVPGGRGADLLSAAHASLRAAELKQADARASAEALIGSTIVEIRGRRNLLVFLERLTQGASTLIQALDAELAIGDVESLNLANAYLSRLDALTSRIDAWLGLLLASHRLQVIQRAAEGAGAAKEVLERL